MPFLQPRFVVRCSATVVTSPTGSSSTRSGLAQNSGLVWFKGHYYDVQWACASELQDDRPAVEAAVAGLCSPKLLWNFEPYCRRSPLDPRFHIVGVLLEPSVVEWDVIGVVNTSSRASPHRVVLPHPPRSLEPSSPQYRRGVVADPVAYRVSLCRLYPEETRLQDEADFDLDANADGSVVVSQCCTVPFAQLCGPRIDTSRCVCLRRLCASSTRSSSANVSLLKWFHGNRVKIAAGGGGSELPVEIWSSKEVISVCLNPAVFTDVVCDMICNNDNNPSSSPIDRTALIRFLRLQGVALQSPLDSFPSHTLAFVPPTCMTPSSSTSATSSGQVGRKRLRTETQKVPHGATHKVARHRLMQQQKG